MPNGGVPINLELAVGPLISARYVLHQHGGVLRVLERFQGQEPPFQEIASFRISREFLVPIVKFALTGTEDVPTEGCASMNMALEFSPPSLQIKDLAGGEVLAVSGDALRILAGFMAYWVDHDGLQVSREIPIQYESSAFDDLQREWTLNWSY